MLASDYTVVIASDYTVVTCFKKKIYTPTFYDISSPYLMFIKSTIEPYNNTICALTRAYTGLSSVIFET